MKHGTCRALVPFAALVAPSALALGDITSLTQTRQLEVLAVYYSTVVPEINVHDLVEAPGLGVWNETRSADSGYGSAGAASLNSDVSSAFIGATGTASTRSPITSIIETASGAARVLFRVEFTADSATAVQYSASIPVAHPAFITPPWTTQSVSVSLRNVDTGASLSTITSAWGQPYPVPPVSVALVLQPARYEILAILELVGGGNHANIMYSDSASFTVGLTTCYANCDASPVSPVLNVNDFLCFLSRYAAGSSYANCDQSTEPPVLNVGDFLCFLNKFAAGCP